MAMSMENFYKQHCLNGCVMFFGTLAFLIAHMAAQWMFYTGGHNTLWEDCVFKKHNGTECRKESEKDMECRGMAMRGPAWLRACRVLACVGLILFVLMHYVYSVNKYRSFKSTTTLKGQINARLHLIYYFGTGVTMTTAAIVYQMKYENYYIEEGKGEDMGAGFGLIVAFVGGAVSLLNSMYLFSQEDTGLMAYLKKKLCKCGSGGSSNSRSTSGQTQSSSNGRNGGDVEVRSKWARIVFALQNCGRKCSKTTNPTNDTNNNDSSNRIRQTTNASGGNASSPTRSQSTDTSGHTVVAVVSTTDETRGSNPDPQATVYVIGGNEGGNVLSPVPPRAGSVASVSRLNVEVMSLSGAENPTTNTTTNTTTTTTSITNNNINGSVLAPPPYAYDQHGYFSQPPPSYEDVVKADSNC